MVFLIVLIFENFFFSLEFSNKFYDFLEFFLVPDFYFLKIFSFSNYVLNLTILCFLIISIDLSEPFNFLEFFSYASSFLTNFTNFLNFSVLWNVSGFAKFLKFSSKFLFFELFAKIWNIFSKCFGNFIGFFELFQFFKIFPFPSSS